MPKLSHHESHVLALVHKWQPTTAYFVRKALGQRLASNVSESPGSVYPALERLKRAGLVIGEPDEGDGRRTERLRCSAEGAAAIRAWLTDISAADLLPEDPWRTRIVFLDLLAPNAAREWLFSVRETLEKTAARIEAGRDLASDTGAVLEIAHARLVTAARIAWVNEAIALLSR